MFIYDYSEKKRLSNRTHETGAIPQKNQTVVVEDIEIAGVSKR